MKIFKKLFKRKEKDKKDILTSLPINESVNEPVDKDESEQFNVISFKPGFQLTELPIITLYQGENNFNFLLDTGSNDSIIDGNIINKIEHTPCEEKSELFGMEGNSQIVHICNITLSYEGEDYPYTYLICDMKEAFSKIKAQNGVTLHGIIGSKFFNAYKYVLDFDKLIAYSKK